MDRHTHQNGLVPGYASIGVIRRLFLPRLFFFALGVFLLSSVGAGADTAEPVVYRLKWLFNTSVVGALYSDVNGLFQDQGLAVTVKAGGPERDAIREIELGYADFGVASADQVIRALAKGSPVVVVAQLFQINPLQWIYRGDGPAIETVADLKGKTIGITYGGNDETIMQTLLSANGITRKQVRLFS
ncbi:MAG: ABC transporter substrate-binding protein, partial [Deltaproteobacteria bacterium]|nr:ABC transporter substrate-binding protein [Deltaproteobacteria bacterium]